MKFCILFALACVCPVAFSHKRYIAIPVSALINGTPDREGNAVVYDINPLQVRDVGAAGRSRSSSTSTAVRRISTAAAGSGERSAVTSTAVRNRSTIPTGSFRRIATGTPRGTANIITRSAAGINRSTIPTGSFRRIATGTRRGTANIITRAAAGINRRDISAGSIRRIAAGTRRGAVGMITRTPAITRMVGSITPSVTYIPSETGTYVDGNVRYVSSVSPRYTSSYVNSVYQPTIVAGSSYLPSVSSTRYAVSWPGVQRASNVVHAAMQQPLSNSLYLGWPMYQSYIHNQPSYTSII